MKPSLIRQIHALKRPDSLDLALGEPPMRIDAELWRRGLARHEREPRGYTPNLGRMDLREAIAAHHGVKAENVIVTVGSEQALFLVFFSLLKPGDEVIIPELAYPAYAGLAEMVGATTVRVPLTDFALSSEAVNAAITARTKFVVSASPSNPFGRLDPPLNVRTRILSDEIYRDLSFQPGATPRCELLVSGLSKSCAMTGDRLGYLIAPADLVQQMWPIHQLTVTCASTLSQQLALEAFLDPRFLTQHRDFYVAKWRRAKTLLDAHKIPYVEPQGAFYVMCPIVPEGEDAFEFCKRVLAEKNVVLVPGTAFGPSGQRYVRMSFASDQFEAAIPRIAL